MNKFIILVILMLTSACLGVIIRYVFFAPTPMYEMSCEELERCLIDKLYYLENCSSKEYASNLMIIKGCKL